MIIIDTGTRIVEFRNPTKAAMRRFKNASISVTHRGRSRRGTITGVLTKGLEVLDEDMNDTVFIPFTSIDEANILV